MFMIRRESGYLKTFGGFVDGSETFAGRWVPGLLALYTELDCERGMTRALSHLLNRNLGDHTADAQWPMDLVFMVEAALELGDREAVHVLRPFVAHYEGKNLLAGQFVALFGSADRYLARIAALTGESAAAERHFGAALEMDRQMCSVVHVAETLARQALFAASRDRAEEARRLADEARAIAAPIGQTRIVDLVGSLRQEWSRRSERPGGRGTAVAGGGPEQSGDRRTPIHQHQHSGQPRPQYPAQDRRRQPYAGCDVRRRS